MADREIDKFFHPDSACRPVIGRREDSHEAGARAYRAKHPLYGCPFPSGSAQWGEWRKGWLDAEATDMLSRIEPDPLNVENEE